MMAGNELLMAYYGDDFTGSTDALEFLTRAGVKTVLFIEPPSPAQLARYKGLQAIGVAGMTRSMSPAQMESVLQPAFTALKAIGARHVHYKVCSTFDSSPTVGSIGKAIDTAAPIFGAAFIPLLVAAPVLGRYCAFGNLFARMGIGSTGQIFRLDRHPSMSKHPTTPADEADLRLHLARQTQKRIGLLDMLHVDADVDTVAVKLGSIIDDGAEIVLFDAVYQHQLQNIGRMIDVYADGKTLFSVGSSGIEMALGAYWNSVGALQTKDNWPLPGKAASLLVLSGSCSPVTSGQIDWAIQNGFAAIAMDTVALANHQSATLLNDYIHRATAFINEGKSVIIHTNHGADDPRRSATEAVLAAKGLNKAKISAETSRLYGTALGAIARAVAEQTSIKRILIAGGDTSSYAARAMGVEAVEMIAPLAPGAPLCKAFAPNSAVDGLELNFKGGQVGAAHYFGMVLQGNPDYKLI